MPFLRDNEDHGGELDQVTAWFIVARPADVSFMIDQVLTDGLATHVHTARIGMDEMFRLLPQAPLFQDIHAAVAPITELAPGAHAHLAVRGLGLANMDARVRGDERAAAFLAGDLAAALAARGVAVEAV